MTDIWLESSGQHGLTVVREQIGRSEDFELNGRKHYLNLIGS
jgi:hypothetical protein